MRDLDSVERAAQLTVPDEPLDVLTLLALSDSLRDLARDVQRKWAA